MGIIKVKATNNLDKKVVIVASQIDLLEYLFCDSWEMWIPRESEKVSAIAMVKMPPTTAALELVLAFRPTIRPRVVIIPDVKPKLNPVLIDSFTI